MVGCNPCKARSSGPCIGEMRHDYSGAPMIQRALAGGAEAWPDLGHKKARERQVGAAGVAPLELAADRPHYVRADRPVPNQGHDGEDVPPDDACHAEACSAPGPAAPHRNARPRCMLLRGHRRLQAMPALVKVADAQRIHIGIGRPTQECTGMEDKSGAELPPESAGQ